MTKVLASRLWPNLSKNSFEQPDLYSWATTERTTTMFAIEKITCSRCNGSGKICLQDRQFAICGSCNGQGYKQRYQKLTAAQIFGMIWKEDPALQEEKELKYKA